MVLEEVINKYTDQNSKYLNIDGLKVHYKDEGEGEVLVLLHGTFSSLHTFDSWASILKKHYRVIRLDLPGFGITGPSIDNVYSISKFLDFIGNFLDLLNVNKYHLAGNSLGGWLAWELALKAKDKIGKLVLLNAAGYISDKNYPLPFVIAQTPVLRNVFNYIPKAVVRRFIRQVFNDQTVVTDELVERYYCLIQREGNLNAFISIANSNLKQNTQSLNYLDVPVLIMWGDKDRWISPEHALFFKNDIPNSRVLIYKDVGHVPMEEIPEKSANDLIDFLVEK
ncbi:MAG: alpha/beta hydrolase [Flavobacteriales bacterium]|nr:alpha/beta hydrolase [Flavobacteriales bacterium]